MDRPTPPPFALEELPAPPGVRALRLAGELDLATTGDVGARLSDLDGVHAVVLDLDQVVFIDSTMLRLLLEIRERAGRLLLSGAAPVVVRLLELTRTEELIELAGSREQALELAQQH